MKYLLVAAAFVSTVSAAGYIVKNPNGPFPDKTESGQTGTNNCGTTDAPDKLCQTLHINSPEDFCLWAPPRKTTVGESERYQVSWCTQKGHGSRLIPKGALTGVHWLETPNYIQITGTGDFTKMNIIKGDAGGELDPHGADGLGNPIGSLVIANFNGKLTQATEWHEFISSNEFCIRVCKPGGSAKKWCEHIYDVMGCYWNDPGSYQKGSFDQCKGDSPKLPPGIYSKNGGLSTWHQGINPTPAGQAAGKSSQCAKIKSPGGLAYGGAAPTTTKKTTTPAKPTATGKTCSKTSDCAGQKIPGYSHQFCSNKRCSFGCNKGYVKSSDGKSCVAGNSSSTPKNCSKTTDCAGQVIPAYSHQLCGRSQGVCTFGCNSGYKTSSDGKSCVRS